jgi:hypothetical protein
MQLRITTPPGNASIAAQRISRQPKLILVDDAGMPTLSRAVVRRDLDWRLGHLDFRDGLRLRLGLLIFLEG